MLRPIFVAVLALCALSISFPAFPSEWLIETVDSAGDVGRSNSIAVDANGNVHISYYHASETNPTVKYAKRSGGAWSTEVVRSLQVGNVYSTILPETSIALDSSGNPHFSYTDGLDSLYGPAVGDLMYASRNASTWDVVNVGVGDDTYYSSLAIDSSDLPHISYQNRASKTLRYVFQDGVWNDTVVDSADPWAAGAHSSLALDGNGSPHISYRGGNGRLKYASWNGSDWTTETVDSEAHAFYTSLALDASGNPQISYLYNGSPYTYPYHEQRVAISDGTSWDIHSMEPLGGSWESAIAVDSTGNTHLVYGAGSLRYGVWDGSQWRTEVVDSVHSSLSFVLDDMGFAHISYYSGGDLKYATNWQIPEPTSFSLVLLAAVSLLLVRRRSLRGRALGDH